MTSFGGRLLGGRGRRHVAPQVRPRHRHRHHERGHHLMELESGEQLASVSSLNPQAVFGGDLMSRIAFAQFDAGNLRKLQTRIVGLLNQHIEQVTADSGVLAKWIYKVVIVGNTCMHHLLLGIDPSLRRARALRARDAPSPRARPRASSSSRSTPRRASASCPSWPASSAPTRWRWRWPPASATRPSCGSRSTSAPTARCCSARAIISGRAPRPPARRSRARRSATGCARRSAPSTASASRTGTFALHTIGDARRPGDLRLGHHRRHRGAARRGRHRLDRADRRRRARPPAAGRCASA